MTVVKLLCPLELETTEVAIAKLIAQYEEITVVELLVD
jgi:hypothetical protein